MEVMEKSGWTFWTCSFLFQIAASRGMINMMGSFQGVFFLGEKFNSKQQLQDMVIPLQSRWRNSHVLVFHSPLLSHILGVAPSTFTIQCRCFTQQSTKQESSTKQSTNVIGRSWKTHKSSLNSIFADVSLLNLQQFLPEKGQV